MIPLDIQNCDAPAEIARAVELELGVRLAPGQAATIVCDGQFATLRVQDALTGHTLSRTIDVDASLAGARQRLIALAIVELLSANTPAPAAPAAVHAPGDQPPGIEAVAPPPARSRALRIGVDAGYATIRGSDRWAPHVGVRVETHRAGRHFAWIAEVGVSHDAITIDEAPTSNNALTVEGAAALHLGPLDLGGGWRIATTHRGFDARWDNDSRFTSMTGPFVMADLGVPVGDNLQVRGAAQFGLDMFGLYGYPQRGAQLQIDLGVAWKL